MKFLRFIGLVMLGIGLAGLVLVSVVPRNMISRAQLVQRIKPYDTDTAALTGEVGTPIGEPQQMIISDEKAFLPFRPDQSARQVNDDYMKAHGEYPLQVKTVEYVSGLLWWVFVGAILFGAMLGFLMHRKIHRLGTAAKPSERPT